jgi:hypothetical protein
MHFVHLILLSDYIPVQTSRNEHYTKKEYFLKQILFSIIYLLLEWELNHNNHSEQELIMSIFVQATEYEVNMYAKLCIFVDKYWKVWLIEIFYKEIILQTGFGQP